MPKEEMEKILNVHDLSIELNLPKTLYKIRSLSSKRDWGTFLSSSVYLPNPSTFNDPYDCNIPLQYENYNTEKKHKKLLKMLREDEKFATDHQIQKFAKEFVENEPLIDPDNLDYTLKKNRDHVNKVYGILCLVKEIENTLMWSYYGESHTGFAIGYNSEKLISTGAFSIGGDIKYSEEMPLFDSDSIEAALYSYNMLFHKSHEWVHESEYRLIHRVIDGKRLLKFDPEVVSEVVFGASVSDSHLNDYTDQLIDKYPHIKISQMKTNKTSFGIKKEIVFDPDLLINFG